MINQTPPVVSDEQYGKLEQVFRDIIRKGKITGPEFQHVLGHPSFTKEIETNVNSKVVEYRQSLSIIERPAFMTVKLGTHKSNKDLRKALLAADNKISDWGGDILEQIEVAKEPEDVNIVVVTVTELGFPNGATRAQIYEKAQSLGLGLLPAEVGPQLRLQYTDQPLGEWILIGMEPITDSVGDLEVFSVGHSGNGRWLYGNDGYPGRVWNGSRRWAFRCK